jgi:hypothetical protein
MMSFSQVQRMFIVEHYVASRSYLTCQNEFRDAFPDSPVPNKSTVYCLANRFRDTGILHWVASYMRRRVDVCIAERSEHFQHLIKLLFFYFNVIYFLTDGTYFRNGLRDFSITLYNSQYPSRWAVRVRRSYGVGKNEIKFLRWLLWQQEMQTGLWWRLWWDLA